MAYTIAYTSFGVKAVLAPEIPNNEGVLRPVTITAPEGSIANSRPPAAGGARALIGHFFPMMVIQALSKALPERVVATVGSPLWCINTAGHRDDGSAFASMFFINGGYGAAAGRDGAHVLSWPSNVSSTPVEMIEQLVPLKVRYRRLRVGSGGEGEFRGGNGQEILVESRAPAPITVAFLAERTRPEAAPAGIAGGGAGAPGEVLIDGQRVDPKTQHPSGRAARSSYARRPAAGTARAKRAQKATRPTARMAISGNEGILPSRPSSGNLIVKLIRLKFEDS